MILIGQYDSPFVRRVAIAPAAVWACRSSTGRGRRSAMPTRSRRINPLRRVPTLVLDQWRGADRERHDAGLSRRARRAGARRCSLGWRGRGGGSSGLRRWRWGLATRSVSLLYERVLRQETAGALGRALRGADFGGVLAMLEKERAAVSDAVLVRGRIGHADIAVACALRFVGEAQPGLVRRALSSAAGACFALRGAAGISGNRAAVGAAEGSELPGYKKLLRRPGEGRDPQPLTIDKKED